MKKPGINNRGGTMEKLKLLKGDCLELLPKIPEKSVDLILCDLPYGTTLKNWDETLPMNDYVEIHFDTKHKNKQCQKMTKEKYLLYAYKSGIPYKDALRYFETNKRSGLWTLYEHCLKTNGVVCLFGQEPFSTYIRNSNKDFYQYDIYWEKERLTNVFQIKNRVGKTVETISVFFKNSNSTYNPQMTKFEGKKRRNTVKNGTLGDLVDNKNKKVIPYTDIGIRYPTQVWKYPREFLKEEHADTQKPIELVKKLILTFSNENDIVLDNTMGWGTTGRACIQTNRSFIGIEKDEIAFSHAVEKIQNEQNNTENLYYKSA